MILLVSVLSSGWLKCCEFKNTFHNLVQELICLLQVVEHVGLIGGLKDVGVGHSFGHDVPPNPVDFVKLAALNRHLLHDVLRVENGLEVQPRFLAPQPGVQDVLHTQQFLLPLSHLFLKRLDVR